MEEESKLFTLMVVSENPDGVIAKYDASREVEPYVKFHYKDSGKLRKKAIKTVGELLENAGSIGLTPFMKDHFEDRLRTLKKMSDFEYYTAISTGCSYDAEGNAMTTENPDGKWISCKIGGNFCSPLKLKDGGVSLQARAGNVDWESMHMSNVELYRTTWKLYHGEKKPESDIEKQIYSNVKYQKRYFDGFGSEEDFVNYSCSYWCYAYADDEKWVDADGHKDYDWITGFYERFVKKLKPDDLVTIFECMKG